jgi:hypothetical protein
LFQPCLYCFQLMPPRLGRVSAQWSALRRRKILEKSIAQLWLLVATQGSRFVCESAWRGSERWR